jgi:hypothetical protein
MKQFAWALLPAIALLALWELAKFLARRSRRVRATTAGIRAALKECMVTLKSLGLGAAWCVAGQNGLRVRGH